MTPFGSDKPQKKFPGIIFLILIVVAALLGGAYYFAPRLERDAPQITLRPDTDVLGRAPLEIGIADAGAGLKSVTVTLATGGAEQSVASEQYAAGVKEKKYALDLSKLSGVKEGPATLRVRGGSVV